jgi:hypothetical protein
VFDDLERSQMGLNELFSCINATTEHQMRHVVLAAHQKELRKKDPDFYDRTKEKVIGRVISMNPNSTAAADHFISRLRTNAGTTKAAGFLMINRDLIVDVFDRSEIKNLRLLRNALTEFSGGFDRMADEFKANEEGMRKLLATFLALFISFHSGTGVEADELDQLGNYNRVEWLMNRRDGEAPEASKLIELQAQFQDHGYVTLNGTVISGELAITWISTGYVEPGLLNRELVKSSAFAPKDQEAWQTLWWWQHRNEADVRVALGKVKSQLSERAFRDMISIMHVTGVMLELGSLKIGWDSRASVREEMIAYIKNLEKEGLLATDFFKSHYNKPDFGTGAYGLGFFNNDTVEFKEVATELIDALDRSFWKVNPDRAMNLLLRLKDDPEFFITAIDNIGRKEGVPNYAHIPILVDADPREAVKVLFSVEPSVTLEALDPFKQRIERLEALHSSSDSPGRSERDWLLRLVENAQELARNSSEIKSAQIHRVLQWRLGFLFEKGSIT